MFDLIGYNDGSSFARSMFGRINVLKVMLRNPIKIIIFHSHKCVGGLIKFNRTLLSTLSIYWMRRSCRHLSIRLDSTSSIVSIQSWILSLNCFDILISINSTEEALLSQNIITINYVDLCCHANEDHMVRCGQCQCWKRYIPFDGFKLMIKNNNS